MLKRPMLAFVNGERRDVGIHADIRQCGRVGGSPTGYFSVVGWTNGSGSSLPVMGCCPPAASGRAAHRLGCLAPARCPIPRVIDGRESNMP